MKKIFFCQKEISPGIIQRENGIDNNGIGLLNKKVAISYNNKRRGSKTGYGEFIANKKTFSNTYQSRLPGKIILQNFNDQ
jgi:hypothetical protein